LFQETENKLTGAIVEKQNSVLIVDWDKSWRELLSKALPPSSFYTDSAVNFIEAIAKIKDSAETFDVIITELYLDEDDPSKKQGFDLMDEIWKISRNKHARIIIVTKKESVDDFKEYLKRNHGRNESDFFLLKPPLVFDFNTVNLVSLVEIAVKKARKELDAERKKKVFGITPFSDEFIECNDTIKDILKSKDLEYIKADKDGELFPLSIPEQIKVRIRDSWFSIANLTLANPNVYFEIGFAHGIGRNVIFLTKKIEYITNRLRIRRAHEYEDSMKGVRNLRTFLTENILEIEKEEENDNPIEIYPQSSEKVNCDLCFILSCGNVAVKADSNDTFNQIINPCLKKRGFDHKMAYEVNIHTRDQLSDWIQKANLVIADLTGHDPDICYLIGLAYGRGKVPIILARKGEEVPFDFNVFDSIIYSKGQKIEIEQAKAELLSKIDSQFPDRPKVSIRSKPKIRIGEHMPTKPIRPSHVYSIDAAILTILPEEYSAIRKRLANIRKPDFLETNLFAWEVGDVACPAYKGTYSVALGRLSQAGNLTSQEAALSAIDQMQPRYIFLVGVAGGLKKLALGDVAVANYIRGYDFGKIDGGFQVSDLWLTPTDMGLFNGASTFADNSNWQSTITINPPSVCTPRHWIGEIASGDKVIDDLSDPFVQAVLKKFPKAIGFEMEGAGAANAMRIAHAKSQVGRFIVIRGISDLPRLEVRGDDAHGTVERDNWKPYAADAAAAFTISYIASGLPERPLRG
jgi:nucleoside phosphorylase/CheY-like chemotaxis protein